MEHVDANPWLERRVLAYAHQGGEIEEPSSTLFAIDRALEIGMTGIELDVHATKDGVLVVGHDATVDRTTDGSGAIASLTIDEVKSLDAAYWFVPGVGTPHDRASDDYPYRGRASSDECFRIATLDEVLDRLPGVVLNLDIKQTAPDVVAYEPRLAETLTSYGRSDVVIVASFSDLAIRRFSELAPDVATAPGQVEITSFVQAVIRDERPDEAIARHSAIQLPPRFSGIELVTEQLVAVAHELGLAVHVWTVDDPAEMERLCALGVDGIMTDRPSVLSSVLETLDVGWSLEAP